MNDQERILLGLMALVEVVEVGIHSPEHDVDDDAGDTEAEEKAEDTARTEVAALVEHLGIFRGLVVELAFNVVVAHKVPVGWCSGTTNRSTFGSYGGNSGRDRKFRKYKKSQKPPKAMGTITSWGLR